MKRFVFEFPIKGTACLTIEAKSLKDAAKKFQKGEGEGSDAEWDFDFPYHFKGDEKELKDYLSYEEDDSE